MNEDASTVPIHPPRTIIILEYQNQTNDIRQRDDGKNPLPVFVQNSGRASSTTLDIPIKFV
jgi:hypothetical protein